MQLSCACVLYLLLVADFFNDLFQHHSLSYSMWTVIAGGLLVPCVFLNQLKRISWLSMFSVVALVMVFVSVIGYGVTKRYTWDFKLGVTTLQGFPVAWGIILFSFVCHPYLPGKHHSLIDGLNKTGAHAQKSNKMLAGQSEALHNLLLSQASVRRNYANQDQSKNSSFCNIVRAQYWSRTHPLMESC